MTDHIKTSSCEVYKLIIAEKEKENERLRLALSDALGHISYTAAIIDDALDAKP